MKAPDSVEKTARFKTQVGDQGELSADEREDARGAARRATPQVVAVVGNPNTGKSSLFNALTGFRRFVANYPGVTVDVGRGPVRGSRRALELLDLPGTYSLAPRAPDEWIAFDALCGRLRGSTKPAIVLAVVDASNPVRNLYLVSQVLELGVPVVVALNMVDIARRRGIEVNADELGRRLGVPVVPVVATDEDTVPPLVSALEDVCQNQPARSRVELPDVLEQAVRSVQADCGVELSRAEALRALLDDDGEMEHRIVAGGGGLDEIRAARARVSVAGIDAPLAEVNARYAWINRILDGVVDRRPPEGSGWSARIDRVLTDRFGGAAALLVVLYGVFYAIYAGAAPLMEAVSAGFAWLGEVAAAVLPAGVARSLVQDGLIAGVGGVLVFLPQILILFLFISVLEDCGYLARAAFMVDRLMRPLGLSGRAFIPLLSSFACAVPAIMGTRAIADRRERLMTILLAPLMSCSARLPVYVLLIGALVPQRAWLGGWLRLDAVVMLAMYLVGVVVAIPLAIVLRKTLFAGPGPGFLLELPTYKLPRVRTVLQRMYLAGRGFVLRAGTIILAVNLLVWALGYFPRSAATATAVEARGVTEGWSAERYESELAGAYLRESYLGRLGHFIEPAIRPLGWDWRIGVGVLASFPSREVIIATLGTVCNLEQSASARSLGDALREMRWAGSGERLFTLPVALSVMVFFALCMQCAGTLVVMGRETASWRWPAASFVTLTALAYLAALGTSAGARALGW